MIGWRNLNIGELEMAGEATLQTGPFGTQLKASDYVDDGRPVINVRNIGFGDVRKDNLEFLGESKSHSLRQHQLAIGDIVFGRKGAVERHALIDPTTSGWIQGSDCLRLRLSSEDLDVRYLSAYFKTKAHQDWMQALCSFGATMNSLNQGIVRRITFPAPRIDVQRKVAAVLTSYDDLIENNRRRIALLERMAEQLYREWFVRFRFPGYQQAKFEKGVPRDWAKARFSDLCTLQRGFDLPDAQIIDGNYPVVASTSIKAFHHAFKVEPPVITTGRSGSLGAVLWTNEKAWPLNTALYVKDFRGNSPYFVFHTLRTMHLENFNSGAGVPSLNRNHLKSLPISLPPKPLQDAFANQVGPMQSLKEKLERACAELAKTRDLLLPRLISGKLRVDDLNIQFPPSMQTERA